MLNPDDYTVGWICAIKVEYVAAQVFLDEEHEGPASVSRHDNNSYTLGRIGEHNVVIAALPFGEYGTTSAATVARDMVHSFPNIRIGLMVGIGGGAPSEIHDIRLGDVVVSTPSNGNSGLIQYDFGKNIQDQPFQITGVLNRPPTALLTALAGLQTRYERYGHKLEEAVNSILEKNKKLKRQYKRPDSSSDRLYRSEVVHSDTKQSCVAACDPSGLIPRSERAEDEDNPAIHYGLIASANQLMKNALLRDSLAAEKDVLCFEMEAAGLMNHFPCLVIRGICDYSDSHKNKEWQGYAAMIAAAYAKDLLYRIPSRTVQAEKKLSDILSGLHGIIKEHRDSLQKNIEIQEDIAQKKLSVKEQKERQECHQLFRLTTSNKDITYEWYKDRVEDRVEDTCMWFLNHDHFKRWLKQDSGPLLVTADPGCGKSVLAKYLIDHVLPLSDATVCYFFFKEQDQNTMRQALCALLHQLFVIKPSLIAHALLQYRINGRGLIDSTESLWRVLHSAITDPSNTGSTVIVLDALDECAESEFGDLMRNIKRYFSDNQTSSSKLKYLLTCRPYEQIVSNFRSLLTIFPYIRIPGEEESDAISREVDIFITHQVNLLARDKLLSFEIKRALETRLQQTINRTYLWIYLIFDYLRKENYKKTQKAILSIITTLPQTINEAYSHILGKSEDNLVTHKALSIVLAASRPLTITEMNIAVNIDLNSARDLDLEDDKNFEARLRSCCGLFLSMYHGKIYFLHQTAREFLLETKCFPNIPPKLLWHHLFTMSNAHAILAKICVAYLYMFNNHCNFSAEASADGSRQWYDYIQVFLDYSAKFWNTHFREGNIMAGDTIFPFALKICNPGSYSYSTWFPIYYEWDFSSNEGMQIKMAGTDYRAAYPRMITDLLVAAYCGQHVLVKFLLSQGADVEAKDLYHCFSSLSWASLNGHEAVVKLLLDKGAEFEVKDTHSRPLSFAAWAGHEAVVKLLLEKGADIEVHGGNDRTPLLFAVAFLREAIIKLLLENGADIEARDGNRHTPLLSAASKGHEAVVKLLLENGADIEAKDNNGYTPLSFAASQGHVAVVKLLLEKSADTEAKNTGGFTPLLSAAFYGFEGIVKLLLGKGADTEAKNIGGFTPLLFAAENGHEAIVKLLLDKGADTEAKNIGGFTPLLFAAAHGYEAIVKLLLKRGADIKAKNINGRSPLFFARRSNHQSIIELLERNI